MAKEFLSQEEVDALLKGVTGEEDGAAAAEDGSGPRPYNLAQQERIVRARMPGLELVHERFTGLLRGGLHDFMRRSPTVTASAVRTQKYSEFIRNLKLPANLNLVHVKPLRGAALLVLEPALIFKVIDALFGGDGRFPTQIEGREFTATELRIVRRLLDVVFHGLEVAWQPLQALKFEYVRAEMNTQFAHIATPNEVVVAVSFTLDFGDAPAAASDANAAPEPGAGMAMHLCLPYAMIEPLRDRLVSGMQGEKPGVDPRWLRLLSKEVQAAQVQLVAGLCETRLTLGQVLKLKAGDVIPVSIPDVVVAGVDGVPVMECRYGLANGQYALQVERLYHHGAAQAAAGPVTEAQGA